MYDLSTYSYSFQRRLRDLAYPVEAYSLQLADIDTTTNLAPYIQGFSINSLKVRVEYENGSIRAHLSDDSNDESITYELQPTVVLKPGYLALQNVRQPNLFCELNLQKNVILSNPKRIFSNDSVFDKHLFQTLRNWIVGDCDSLDFYDCAFTKELTIGWLDNLFPTTRRVFYSGTTFEGSYFEDFIDVFTKMSNKKKTEIETNLDLSMGNAIDLMSYAKSPDYEKVALYLEYPLGDARGEKFKQSIRANNMAFVISTTQNEVPPYLFGIFNPERTVTKFIINVITSIASYYRSMRNAVKRLFSNQ